MAKPPFAPDSAQVEKSESPSPTQLTASTTARYRQAKEAHEAAKEQAIRDLTSNISLSPQQMMDAMVVIQDMHRQVDSFTTRIASIANTEIAPNDATTMRDMRANGATDAKIAEWFDTNPTKVNRMINS
ncbi:hypothetical protein UXP70_16370 [Enterobacter cloacae]|uniref:hypothetical protein n=1 Tax=Enterobacter cloacae TaxID=550 RepID=UPI0020064A8E|nr:hypothetical protein [Enterobacter roggenkampii]